MIKNLTGLRFYMALWVVVYHFGAYTGPVISYGFLGVDVFFVLSGYILSYVYFDRFNSSIDISEYLKFVKKRVARIYPMHLITMLGALALFVVINYFVNPTPLYLNHIPFQVTMTHSWGFLDSSRLNYPSWSISAEWFAYLFILPLFFFLIRKSKGTLYVIILFSFLFFQWFVSRYAENSFGQTLGIGIIRIFPEFLIGCLACHLNKQANKEYQIALLIALLLLGGLFGLFAYNKVEYIFIAIIPLTIILLHKGSYLLDIFFGTRIPVFLGEISYSIYMTHYFGWKISGIVQDNFFEEDQKLLHFCLYILLTLLFSIIGYYSIEMPARKWIIKMRIG